MKDAPATALSSTMPFDDPDLKAILGRVGDTSLRSELAHELMRWREKALDNRRVTMELVPRERKRLHDDESDSPDSSRIRLGHDDSYDEHTHTGDDDDDNDDNPPIWLVSGDKVAIKVRLRAALAASGFLRGLYEPSLMCTEDFSQLNAHVQMPEWLHSRTLKLVCEVIGVCAREAELAAAAADVCARALSEFVTEGLRSEEGAAPGSGAPSHDASVAAQQEALEWLLCLVQAASYLEVTPLLELSAQAVFAWLVRRNCPLHVLLTLLPEAAEELLPDLHDDPVHEYGAVYEAASPSSPRRPIDHLRHRSAALESWPHACGERATALFWEPGCADALRATLDQVDDVYVSGRLGLGGEGLREGRGGEGGSLASLALCSLHLKRQLSAFAEWDALLCDPEFAVLPLEGTYKATLKPVAGDLGGDQPTVTFCTVTVYRDAGLLCSEPNDERYVIKYHSEGLGGASLGVWRGQVRGKKKRLLLVDGFKSAGKVHPATGDIEFGNGDLWIKYEGASPLCSLIRGGEALHGIVQGGLPQDSFLRRITHPVFLTHALARVYRPTDMRPDGLDAEEEGASGSILREIACLRHALVSHPHVMGLLSVCVTPEHGLGLVYECLPYDVRSMVQELRKVGRRLSLPSTKAILLQTLRAADHLHSRGVLHRRIKTAAVRFDGGSGLCKLANFGHARVLASPGGEHDHRCLSLEGGWWTGKAPEMILARAGCDHMSALEANLPGTGLPYAFPVDVWAVGTMLLEMTDRRSPFHTPHKLYGELTYLYNILHLLGTPTRDTWHGWTATCNGGKTAKGEEYVGPQFPPADLAKAVPSLPPAGIELLRDLLQVDPRRRITAREALQHPFFAEDSDNHGVDDVVGSSCRLCGAMPLPEMAVLTHGADAERLGEANPVAVWPPVAVAGEVGG